MLAAASESFPIKSKQSVSEGVKNTSRPEGQSAAAVIASAPPVPKCQCHPQGRQPRSLYPLHPPPPTTPSSEPLNSNNQPQPPFLAPPPPPPPCLKLRLRPNPIGAQLASAISFMGANQCQLKELISAAVWS